MQTKRYMGTLYYSVINRWWLRMMIAGLIWMAWGLPSLTWFCINVYKNKNNKKIACGESNSFCIVNKSNDLGNLYLIHNHNKWDKLFPFTLVKEVFKSAMLVGNCSVLNTEFSQTVKCHQIKQSEEVMMPSIHSSHKLELVNTSQDVSSSISNQLSLIKLELEPTDNFSTLNNWSQEKKMLPTTSPEDIIPLENKSLIFALTELESLLITALVSKDSLCSTQSVVEQDQD